jgi:hypothetical protein
VPADSGPTVTNTWLTRVNRFAEVAGLSRACCLESQAPRGFRVEPWKPEGDQPASEAQHRAWSLLAMVAGEELPSASREVIGPGFFAWLADPDDPVAVAFWDVLDGLRPTLRAEGHQWNVLTGQGSDGAGR